MTQQIVIISGGLGNQMFQYAFSMVLQRRYKNVTIAHWFDSRDGIHNGYELERVFGIPAKRLKILRLFRKIYIFYNRKFFGIFSRIMLLLLKTVEYNVIREKTHSYNLEYLQPFYGRKIIYMGHWLCAQYFDNFYAELRNIFSFNINKLSDKSIAIL